MHRFLFPYRPAIFTTGPFELFLLHCLLNFMVLVCNFHLDVYVHSRQAIL
jgi:hypothetical protein